MGFGQEIEKIPDGAQPGIDGPVIGNRVGRARAALASRPAYGVNGRKEYPPEAQAGDPGQAGDRGGEGSLVGEIAKIDLVDGLIFMYGKVS
jgi:hypothetical protein